MKAFFSYCIACVLCLVSIESAGQVTLTAPTITASPTTVCSNGTVTLTATGMAPGGQGSNSSGVLALNGGNYVEVVSNAAQQVAANQDFTYEMWVKPNAFTSNNTYFENGNWNASLTILFRQNSTTDIHLYINGTDRGGINYVPPTGTWTHLALVRSGGASGILTLYADGVSKGTFTAYASAIATTAAMRIGSSVHIGTQLFNGSIDEFRFFKGVALSTTTLDAWRNRELTSSHPNWANVSFEYKFSGNTNNSQGGSPAGTGVGTIGYAAANFYTFTYSGSGTWTTSGAPAAATNEVQSAVPTQVSIGTNGSGTYTCIVSRSGYTSSAASAATASVTVQPVPQGSLSGNTICGDGNANGQLVWTATSGTGPYTVVWNTTSANYPGWGNQSTSSVTSGTAFSNSPTPVVSTTYSLVSVTGANGCARSSSFTTSNGTITVAGPSSGYTLTDFATAGITGFVAPAAVGITWGDDATMATISYTATTWPNCVNYGFGRPSINTAATANPLNLDLRDATNTDLSAGKASFVGTASFQYMSGGANTTQTLSVRCRIIASKALQYFPTQNACMLKANSNFNLQVQMEVLVPSSPALQFPVSGYAAGSWAPVILFCNTVHPPNVTPNIYTSLPTATGSATTSFSTVNALPTLPTASSNTPVCSGSTLSLSSSNGSLTTCTSPLNYSWTGPNSFTSTSSSPSISSVTSAAGGVYTLEISSATNRVCYSRVTTSTVVINTTPAVTNMTASACSGSGFTATPVNSTNGVVPAGTTYSWAAPSVTGGLTGGTTGSGASSITGTLTNPTNTAQTATYTVTPTASGCPGATFTVTVTINPTPAVTAMTASTCSGTGFTATPVNSTNGIVPTGTTYSWAAPSVTGGLTGGSTGSGASSISGTLTNPTNTAQTATYTVTPTSGGCPGSTFTVTATINPKPAVTAMTASACSGSGFTATPVNSTNGVVPTGTTYSWAAPSVTGGLTGGTTGSGASSITGTLTNPTNTAQTATYTVTPTAGSCTGSTFTVTVTINPVPAVTNMTVSSCSGSGFTATPVNSTNGIVPTGTTYSWAAPSVTGGLTGGTTGSGASSITGTLTNPTNTAQTATYTVTPTAGSCTGATFTVTVTINPTPAVTAMTASTCSGTGFTATPVNSTNGIVPTGTTYSWAAPSVTGGLTGGSTGSGASSISGTLTNPTNTAQTATYTVTPTSGGCPGSTFTVTATINPKPAVTAMTASACSGSGFTATPVNSTNGVVPTGTTYSWAAPSVTGGLTGGSTGSGTSSITGTLTNPTNTAQTATYTVTPTAGSCTGSTFTLTVTINPTPAVTNMTASSCSGSGFTATPVNSTNGVVPTGTTYSWAAPSVTGGLTGGTTGSGASSITGTLTNPTSTAQTATYTVTPTAGSCPGATFTVTVTINPKPAVTNLTATVCSGIGFTSTPVDVTDGIVPSGTTYSWAAPSVTGGLTGGSTGSSASSISGTLNNPTLSPQTGTYTVTPSAGGCSGSTFTVTATINPLPAAAITPATVGICIGSSTTLTASGGSSYVWNTGPTTAGITVSPTTATTYSVVVTNGYTCTASASSTVTVNPLPTPTVSPATSVCAGTVGLVYTTQSGMTGYSWSVTGGSITAGGGSTNNTATVTWGAAGTGHVLINYTDGNGCTAAASTDQSITIDQAVTADADVTNLAVPGASSTQIEVCGALGTSLVANNPSIGTGTWTQVAGAGTTTYAPNANANSVTTTISGYSAPAAVTYRWTVVNGACSASSDVVVVYDPAIVINSVLAGCSFVPLPPFSNDSIMILVTATGGSSTLSFSYPPTDELRINVNSGTKVYTAPTDGNSHSFTVSDAFCAQSSAQTTPSTHITDIPFTSSTGVDSAKCFDKNFNKWVTFRDASNNAFLSINDNNQDLGQVTVITYRDATAASISNASTNVCPGVQSVAMKRHFVITATNPPTSPVTLRLYFTPGELSDLISDAQANDLSGNSCTHLDNIYNINELYVTKYTGTLEDGDYTNNDAAGTYKVYGNTTLLPTQPDGPLSKYSNGFSSLFDSGDPHHYVELTVNEFSEIWLHGSQNATPLPTEMIYFEANPIDNSFIRLTWATAIEINNSGFEVERSLDGINWSQIAWVDGHNNSSVQQNYVYNDYNVQASVRYYYRLKKVDNDGAGEYTSVVSAIISGNFSFTVKDFMPNPASGESKLAVLANGQQTVGVAIYNYLGQVVLQQDFDLHKGGNELKFDLSRLAAGSYTALLTSQTNKYTKKLVITR